MSNCSFREVAAGIPCAPQAHNTPRGRRLHVQVLRGGGGAGTTEGAGQRRTDAPQAPGAGCQTLPVGWHVPLFQLVLCLETPQYPKTTRHKPRLPIF